MGLKPFSQLNGRADDTADALLIVAVNENGLVCHRKPRDTDGRRSAALLQVHPGECGADAR
jgi:hypothetical protein